MPVWLKDNIFQKAVIIAALNEHIGEATNCAARLRFSEHHLSHAASASFPSPYQEAAVLTMDGVGSVRRRHSPSARIISYRFKKETHFPHSLGLLNSAFTYYSGFKVNSGAGSGRRTTRAAPRRAHTSLITGRR
jgi:carbamoyltransferase